jgi:flagellar motor protein MotB
MFKKRTLIQEEHDNSFWISYSDILSSLLIIILLVTVYVIYELMATKQNVVQNLEEITKAELVRKETLLDIQEKLKKEGLEVNVADNYSVLRIPESTLSFKSNTYFIPAPMGNGLANIGKILLKELKENKRSEYFDTIFIEGHTDIRSSKRVMGNMGLSTFRAISVWNYWIKNVSKSYANIRNAKGDQLFSVSGYGESRPATQMQISEEDYKKNRRIDIRFTLRKPSSEDYNKVLKMFHEN